MSRIAGRVSRVKTSTNSGSSYTYINGIADCSLSVSVKAINTTSHDDGDFETFMMGRKSLTMDLKLRWDESDPGQIALLNSWISTNTMNLYKFRMQEGAGFYEFTGTGLITKWNPSGPNDDVASVDVSIQLSGTVSASTTQTG